jgi:hypothetical protein
MYILILKEQENIKDENVDVLPMLKVKDISREYQGTQLEKL